MQAAAPSASTTAPAAARAVLSFVMGDFLVPTASGNIDAIEQYALRKFAQRAQLHNDKAKALHRRLFLHVFNWIEVHRKCTNVDAREYSPGPRFRPFHTAPGKAIDCAGGVTSAISVFEGKAPFHRSSTPSNSMAGVAMRCAGRCERHIVP
jgi:hypothetical protein